MTDADGRHGLPSPPPASLEDCHRLAAARLDPNVLQLIDGGAGSGATIRANAAAFDRWALRPRSMSGLVQADLSTEVLGHRLAGPLMFAPSALHGLAHPLAERASARAAQRAELLMVLSSNATVALEQVAAEGSPLWFQFYWGSDRGAVRALVERAEAARCGALCLTVDMPTRPWIDGAMRAALASIGHHASAHGKPRSVHLDSQLAWEHDARLTWDDLAWLRSITTLPLVVKGVMTGTDAALAVDNGAQGVIVSNHGGRSFERGQATLDVLPEVVDQVGDRVEVYVDGGIRRGSDIAIALSLGARAVLVGRPVQWGLAAGGEEGVRCVTELLLGELRSVMTMMGAATPQALGRHNLAPAHPVAA